MEKHCFSGIEKANALIIDISHPIALKLLRNKNEREMSLSISTGVLEGRYREQTVYKR